MKGYRVNERNIGDWTLDGEPKKRKQTPNKISRSFTEQEIKLYRYLLTQISNNIVLDHTDKNNQIFKSTDKLSIEFSRDDMDEFRGLLEKFDKNN
jgi:hypothetical protein